MLTASACKRNGFRQMEGIIWNTTYHITFDGPEELEDSVLKTLNEIDGSLNYFSGTSLLSRINAADTITIDRHIAEVYRICGRLNRESGGMFDPTVTPLINAWGFGKGHTPTADTLRIDSLLKHVGFTKTALGEDLTLVKPAGVVFNFSAVAKGYGVDAVGEMLSRNGVKNWLVEIGGEIACAGESPRGGNWKVSVDRPVQDSARIIHDSQAVVALSGEGLATSGNYRNYHSGKGGKTFGHTISPLTGRPVQTDVLSATVIAPTCAEADAMATTCMAVGSREALRISERMHWPVMLILSDTVIYSKDFPKE